MEKLKAVEEGGKSQGEKVVPQSFTRAIAMRKTHMKKK